MQTLLLLVISSLFIVGIVALYLHLAGFSRRGQIPDTPAGMQDAKQKIQSSHPDSAIIDFKISPNRNLALAQFKDGTGSFLQAIGHKWILHPLNANSIKRITTFNFKKGTGLRIDFNDYTAPSLKCFLENETASKTWLTALQPFVTPKIRKRQ